MKESSFWAFFGFGAVTTAFAFLGGLYAIFQQGGIGSNALGFLLLFLGTSLGVTLGSLLFIRKREAQKS
jgi:hypothetical protein